jgi:hypothetical protein
MALPSRHTARLAAVLAPAALLAGLVPTATAAAGGFGGHFAHMRAYWNAQLKSIAQITSLPDPSLADAYRTGFIYTQIIRSGDQLRTGASAATSS